MKLKATVMEKLSPVGSTGEMNAPCSHFRLTAITTVKHSASYCWNRRADWVRHFDSVNLASSSGIKRHSFTQTFSYSTEQPIHCCKSACFTTLDPCTPSPKSWNSDLKFSHEVFWVSHTAVGIVDC